LIFGSFASVLVYEFVTAIEKESYRFNVKRFLCGRSKCVECSKELKWYNLIPVFSFIFQRGRCSFCNKKIDSMYVLIEIVMMLVFGLVGWWFGASHDWWEVSLVLGMVFVAINILFIDLKTMKIPSLLNWALIGLGFLIGFFVNDLTWIQVGLGGGIGFLFFYFQHVVSKGKWVGLGDADIGMAIGFAFGPVVGMYTILQSYVLGTLVLVPLMLFKNEKYRMNAMIPFGPFLVISLIFSLFLGNMIVNWYIQIFIIF
jgi:leader peptidase (prepilin peptidase)/N-methyltransferase